MRDNAGTVDKIAWFSLNTSELVAHLRASFNENRPSPLDHHLQKFIETAFYASLEREEGRPLTFALVLADKDVLRMENVNRRQWSPLVLSQPIPFEVALVAKIAAAIDRRQTLLAVAEQHGELFISGLVRTNTLNRRLLLSDSFWVPGQSYGPVIITVMDAGVLKIDVGSQRLAVLNKGSVAFAENSLAVFRGGRVWEELSMHAQSASLDIGGYTGVLNRALLSLVERGHGGIVLLLPDDDLRHLNLRYKATAGASAIQDAVRFYSGERLGPSVETWFHLVGSPPPDARTRKIESAKHRAVEEHEFIWDGASFLADLAAVDGALVLLADLTIVGFGAHVNSPQNGVNVQAAQDQEGTKFGKSPMQRLGTRHSSTARFCYQRPGTVGFVVSQDGVVSPFLRNPAEDAVTLWRPVALEWHW